MTNRERIVRLETPPAALNDPFECAAVPAYSNASFGYEEAPSNPAEIPLGWSNQQNPFVLSLSKDGIRKQSI